MFRQDFTCPALLKSFMPFYPYGAITLSGALFQRRFRFLDTNALG
jgi:hypothetical protein